MKNNLLKILLSGLFIAMGMILPMFTSQIKQIGNMLLPMHIPIMLCGLVCGKKYGFLSGMILPIIRSAVFGMPILFPNSIWMSAELATYGFVIGFVYSKIKRKNFFAIYISLICSMLAGRIVWGVVKALLLGFEGERLTIEAFIISGFVNSFIGILLQLMLVPAIFQILKKYIDV